MRKKCMAMLLAVTLLLSGCSVYNQTYVHIEPHQKESGTGAGEAVSARNYDQLLSALEQMVTEGREGGLIYISNYDQTMVELNMRAAENYICRNHPVGAYSVEEITYEVGVSSGKPAISVTFRYRHSTMEIRMIRKLLDMSNVEAAVGSALRNYDASLVVYVDDYEPRDFTQMVRSFGETFPDAVMEIPQVTSGVFGTGSARVIELTFAYQTNRDSLRQMQEQVAPVFASASLYVGGDGSERQKYSQLCGFLMERFDYSLETSITPAYSLLRHGVGDSRAFAVVYAAMCRQAGLECLVVTGTCNGEPWNWNIVRDNGSYFHVDLLRSSGFQEYLDSEMSGYVWDYSAYPVCVAVSNVPEEEAPLGEDPLEQPSETQQATEIPESKEQSQTDSE